MSKGQYAQIETAFILNDQRLDDLSGNDFRLYITLWTYAVNQRTSAFHFDNMGRTLGRLSRNDARSIHFSLTKLLQLCLIEMPNENTVIVCGVENKHPKLKWKNVTQNEVRVTVQEPNRIEENRIEQSITRDSKNVSRETTDLSEVKTYFCKKYEEKMKLPYTFREGKDYDILNGLLKTWNVAQMRAIIDQLFKTSDEFIITRGRTLAVMNGCIDKLAQESKEWWDWLKTLSPEQRAKVQ